MRIAFAKINEKKGGLDTFFESWKKNRSDRIKKYCEKNADIQMLDETRWYTITEIQALGPDKLFKRKSYKTNAVLQKNKDGFEYFIRILERRDPKDAPPKEYIKEELKNIILHRRKSSYLKLTKEELYDRLMKQKNIKKYIKI